MALDPVLAAPTATSRLELELVFADDKGGQVMSRWGIVWNTDFATTIARVNALVDAIEAIIPANALRAANLVQVVNTEGGIALGVPAPESARAERLLVGLRMTPPQRDEVMRITTLLRSNGNGQIVNEGVVNSTHSDLVALRAFFDPAGANYIVAPIVKDTIATPAGFKGYRYTDR